MLNLIFARLVKVKLLDGTSMETQHGVASVRSDQGLTKVGFAVDRPEILGELTPEALADMVEQINDHGYTTASIKIAAHGTRTNYDLV